MGAVDFHSDGYPRLHLGDCRTILPSLKAVDAVVTDPPYGIAFRHSGKGSSVEGSRAFRRRRGRHTETDRVFGDDEPFDPAPLLAFPKVALFGANHYADRLPPSGAWFVWDKRDGMASNSFSDCELVWTKGSGNAARLFRYLWNGVCQAGEKGGPRHHPSQKPVAVMEWVIRLLTKPGDVVLDPYMGSGSTGVACLRTGRRFIGCEIDPTHFETARRRITEAQRQRDLFVEMAG